MRFKRSESNPAFEGFDFFKSLAWPQFIAISNVRIKKGILLFEIIYYVGGIQHVYIGSVESFQHGNRVKYQEAAFAWQRSLQGWVC